MNMQPSLFGADPYGNPVPALPISAVTDPATSHAAGRRHERSGKRARHAEIVFELVRRHPGSTYRELWRDATDADREELKTFNELARRLGDMKQDPARGRVGKVRHGAKRACTVQGALMVTWEVA